MNEEVDLKEPTEEDSGMTMNRRNVLRSAAVVGGTAASGGTLLTLGPGSAEAVPDWLDCDFVASGGGAIIGGAAGGPGGALMGGTIGYNVGQEYCPQKPDIDAEQQEADFENWVEIYTAARANAEADINQLEQARRDANGMLKAGVEDAMFAMFNEAQSGSEKATGLQSAKDACNEQFAQTIKGYLNHYSSRAVRWEGDINFLASADFATSESQVVGTYNYQEQAWVGPSITRDNGVGSSYTASIIPDGDLEMFDVDLPNGETEQIPIHVHHNESNDTSMAVAGIGHRAGLFKSHISRDAFPSDPFTDDPSWGSDIHFISQPRIREPDHELYDAVDESEVDTSKFDGHKVYFDVEAFVDTWAEIESVREDAIAQVEDLVDANWQGAVDGTYSLAELTSSGAQLNAMDNASSFREVALSFRTQGYWMASTPTVVEMEGENGDVREYDGQLAWAREAEPDPLQVGAAIDATTLAGTLYFAYNVEDENGDVIGATYSILQDSFTIKAAEDESGTITWEQQQGPDTSQTTDEIINILRENNEAKSDAEQARQDINVNTGGGFSLFGDGGLGGAAGSLIATVMIAIAALFGWNVISDDS